MSLLHTVFWFLIALAILIAVHEYGHFQVARWCGVKVIRFSLGFGKVVWQKKIGADKTEFALSLIPLGGYVKMLDEREADSLISAHELPRAFNRQPVYKRIAIVAAGPIANFLLAITLFTGLYWWGVGNYPRKRHGGH
jgi:regulator of sigma E protease